MYMKCGKLYVCNIWASQVALVKNPSANAGDIRDVGLVSRSGRIPWRMIWQHTPVFLSGKSHGQRGLVGYIQSIVLHKAGHD